MTAQSAQWTKLPASETRTRRPFGYVLSVRPDGAGRWHYAVVYTLTGAAVETGTRRSRTGAQVAADSAYLHHEDTVRARNAVAEVF